MKNLFLIPLLSLFVFNSSFANKICDAEWDDSLFPNTNYLKKKVEIPEIKVSNKKFQTFVNGVLVKHSEGAITSANSLTQAVDLMAKHIKASGLSAAEKSKAISQFAKDLNPGFEAMVEKFPVKGTVDAPDLVAWKLRKDAIDEVKSVKYQIANHLFDVEQFKKSQFKKVKKDKFIITQGDNQEKLTHMQLSQYPDYVESLLYSIYKPTSQKAKLYNKIDEGSLGVLELGDIRDITSYNLWPMYLKRHDMRHIHYALSHPMALTVMMRSTRSTNHYRYTMMAGLYEGVDRVQYAHETNINSFFAKDFATVGYQGIKRNLDLEEAMLTIALASDDELVWLAKKADIHDDLLEYSSLVKDWKPKIVEGTDFNGNALSGLSLEDDVKAMVEQFSDYVKKSEYYKLKLYDKPKLALKPEEDMFMKMMNFQIEPENPEIVIDGLRFKNDGRPHFRDWGDSMTDVPIGIGNQ